MNENKEYNTPFLNNNEEAVKNKDSEVIDEMRIDEEIKIIPSENNLKKVREKKSTKKILPTSNKDLTYEGKKDAVIEILGLSSTCIVTTLSHFLIMTVSLIFLGHQDPTLFQLNSAQIAICFIYTFGLNFAVGSMYAFDLLGMKSHEKGDCCSLDKFYNKGKIFCTLTFLMIILPLNFNADYILYFLGIDDETSILAGKFCKISLISVFFSMLAMMNLKYLHILQQVNTEMFINLFVLSLHIISCMTFVVAFNLGAIGVAISLSISSFTSYCISTYYIDVHNESDQTSLFQIDMAAINSNKFYHYVVVGIKNGLFNSVKYFPYNLIVFSSYYIDKTSLASNAILYDYINILYTIVVGLCLSMNNDFYAYLIDSKNMKIRFKIKSQTVLALVVCALMAVFNFLFHDTISFLYVNNMEIANKFSHIVKLYSFFILCDWANNITLSFIKNIPKHTQMNSLHSLTLLTIFLPLGLLLSFVYGYGYAGIWYSIFLSQVVFTIINFYYIYNLDLAKESLVLRRLKNKENSE